MKTVILKCIPVTRVVVAVLFVAAVLSVDGPVLVLDKEGESIMQITKVRVI